MKKRGLPPLLVALALPGIAFAQETKPAPEPYTNDFESEPLGERPESMRKIDGDFEVVELEGGGKALQMSAEPLAENALIFGPSLKGGGTVSAKIRSYKKRRSSPRFGVGLHGLSGFRLRVVPSKKAVELVKNEEVVATAPYDWKADSWTKVELVVAADGEDWKVEGRAWNDGDERPEKATITLAHEGSPGQGKASIWGTAYSGRVVEFDDVGVVPGQ